MSPLKIISNTITVCAVAIIIVVTAIVITKFIVATFTKDKCDGFIGWMTIPEMQYCMIQYAKED